MKQKGLWLPVALLAVAVFVRNWAEPKTSLHYYSPQGYVEMANTLILQDKIRFNCESNQIEPLIEPSSPEWHWFENSYLRSDIDAFNDQQQRFANLFIVEGCRLVSVNPFAHVVPLPKAGQSYQGWRGRLLYRTSEVEATLVGGHQEIPLKPVRRPLKSADFRAVVIGGATAPRDVIVAKFRFPKGAEVQAAEVQLAGSQGVLREKLDARYQRGHDVLINGFSLPNGRILALHDGDWIQFVRPQPDSIPARTTYLYSSEDLSSLISYSRRLNDRWQRTTKRSTLGFVDDLVRSMNEVVRRIDSSSTGSGRSRTAAHELEIRLSVDRALQDRLSRRLKERVDSSRPSRPIRAGMTVLDLFSGEALALAGYPSQPDDLERFAYLSKGERRRLAINQNMVRHPIGSAGKPIWAAAILSEYPFLGQLRIPPHSGPTAEMIAGIPLGADRGYEIHTHSETGFTSFLAQSCNKYMVELATMTFAIRDECRGRASLSNPNGCIASTSLKLPPQEQLTIGRYRQTFAPDMSRFIRKGTGGIDQIQQNPIFFRLGKIAGIRTFSEEDPSSAGNSLEQSLSDLYRASRYHMQPWKAVAANLQPYIRPREDQLLLTAGLASISPEHVNLGLNKIDRIRSEWASMLLGGGTSVWNNVQLAEAVSGIVTGRRVRASFTSKPPEAPKGGQEEIAELTGYARRMVLAGMQEAARSGTAARLRRMRPAIEERFPGYQVLIYAKTGTPRVELFLPSAIGRLIRSGYLQGEIYYDADDRKVVIKADWRTRLRQSQPALLRMLEEIVRQMNESPQDYQSGEGAAAPHSPLVLDGAKLSLNEVRGLAAQRQVGDTNGAVLLAAVLVIPKADAKMTGISNARGRGSSNEILSVKDLDPTEAFGIAVALYLEDVGQSDSSQAVVFLETVQKELLDALELARPRDRHD